ncbi:MAG TPA: hypothetical protein PLC61_07990 [Chitinophagales bacterium]|nr:hypothetical protein [Chitinophagales bacterium]
MIGCDFLGLNELVYKNHEAHRDSGYLYCLISIVLNIENKKIILEGKTDISSLKKAFKVFDRTNVIRILDRLAVKKLVQYQLAQARGNESVFIIISPLVAEYFFQK